MTSIRNLWVSMALLSVLTVCPSSALGQGHSECSKYWGAKAVFIGKIARTYRGISKASQYVNGVEKYSNTTVLHITFKAERSFTWSNSRKGEALVEVECADCVDDNNLELTHDVSFRRGCDCEGTNLHFFTEVDATVYRRRCDQFLNIQKSLRPVLFGSNKIVFEGFDCDGGREKDLTEQMTNSWRRWSTRSFAAPVTRLPTGPIWERRADMAGWTNTTRLTGAR
jgi:hypothetical protein